jgi:outer membrane receptor protein involved in Fe transport
MILRITIIIVALGLLGEAEAVAAPRPGEAHGVAVLAEPALPVVGAEVEARGPGGQEARTRTDAAGAWRLEALAPGPWRVQVSGEDLEPALVLFEVRAGEAVRAPDAVLAPLGLGEEMEVTAARSVSQQLRESAEAVRVVELGQARVRGTSLGEVLRRTEGLTLQRAGGIGSPTVVSLNGLLGRQVRLFVDGVPLELSGWGEDVADVPPVLLERVEVYRGVVPLRLGADALGGAVNLVVDERVFRSFAHASYQHGSFGLHRLAAAGRQQLGGSGLFVGAHLAWDRAENDYLVDVEVPDARGVLQAVRLPRFHDGFRALRAGLEAGVVGQDFADLLVVRGAFARSDKQLQHNPVMSVPFGEVQGGSRTWALSARYRKVALGPLTLEALVHGASRHLTLRDRSTSVYDWYGQRVNTRLVPGERGQPYDAWVDERAVVARTAASLALAPGHQLQFTLAPQSTWRVGDNLLDSSPTTPDLLNQPKRLTSLVGGLGWEARDGQDMLENQLFLKGYLLDVRTQQEVRFSEVRTLRHRRALLGVGDAVRLRLGEALLAKASYEWAVRLPDADELFGDGRFVAPNAALTPERSHNLNLGLAWARDAGGAGHWEAELGLFGREVSDQVIFVSNALASQYQNVLSARALGAEGGVRWRALDGRLRAALSGAYTDLRNTSAEGTHAPYRGDRLPNRPFLSASAEVEWQLDGPLPGAGDALRLYATSRYTHAFFRGWESLGALDTKQQVPAQLVHGAGLTWGLGETLAASVEVSNLADARTYDVVGVQGPGRAFSLTLTGSLDLAPAPGGG